MKTSYFFGCSSLLVSAIICGCAAPQATTADSTTATTMTPVADTAAPAAAQSDEGPRPAFLSPRSDGTYVDKKGNVLVPPKVMLGVTMEQPGPALAKHMNLNPANCTLLVDVIPGLPAANAGLMDHDIVVAVDGSSDAGAHDIRSKLKKMKPGETIVFTIQRGNSKQTMTLTSTAWIAEHMVRPLQAGSFAQPGLNTDAERDDVPRELLPVMDRLSRIEAQLREIQVEMKRPK